MRDGIQNDDYREKVYRIEYIGAPHDAQPLNKQQDTKTYFDRYGETLDNHGDGFDTDGEVFDRCGIVFRQRRETILNTFDRYGQPPLNLRQSRDVFDKSGRYEYALDKFGISPGRFSTNMGNADAQGVFDKCVCFLAHEIFDKSVWFHFDKTDSSFRHFRPLFSAILHSLFDTSARCFRQICKLRFVTI